MLNAKEIAAMYSEYESLQWLVKQHENRNSTMSGLKVEIKPGVLNCAGAHGVWHRNSRKFIEEQCEQAFIDAVHVSIKILEQEFADLGVEIEPEEVV